MHDPKYGPCTLGSWACYNLRGVITKLGFRRVQCDPKPSTLMKPNKTLNPRFRVMTDFQMSTDWNLHWDIMVKSVVRLRVYGSAFSRHKLYVV